MRIQAHAMLTISDATNKEKELIKETFSFRNPMRRDDTQYWIPERLSAVQREGATLLLPGRTLDVLLELFPNVHVERAEAPARGTAWPTSIELREYQREAVYCALQAEAGGIIVMPTGAGKTHTALAVLAELGLPTLWVSPGIDLSVQAYERAVDCLELPPEAFGMMGGKQHKHGERITFATIQSACKFSAQDLQRYAVLVLDEVHNAALGVKTERGVRIPSQYEKLLSKCDMGRIYGLTATPTRGDGMWCTTEWLAGSIIHTITWETLYAQRHLMRPTLSVCRPKRAWPKKYPNPADSWSETLELMTHWDARNAMIAEHIRQAVDEGGTCMVLSERLEHLQSLLSFVQYGALIDGVTPKERREQLWRALREREERVIFATYQLAGEGIDAPALSDVFFALPFRDEKRTMQAVGRIMRPALGKDRAVVHDYIDAHGVFQNQYRNRVAAYQYMGIESVEFV